MIRSTGIIRKVDDLGRIVLPSELRKKLGIEEQDTVEFFLDGTSVILRKYSSSCVFCGSPRNLVSYNDKLICKNCQNKIATLQ